MNLLSILSPCPTIVANFDVLTIYDRSAAGGLAGSPTVLVASSLPAADCLGKCGDRKFIRTNLNNIHGIHIFMRG